MKQWLVIGVMIFLMYKVNDKSSLMESIYGNLPPKEAGVMAAMILGDKSGLGKEMYQYLKDSGLVHLVIVSGSNVMLIVSNLIEGIASWVGRKKAIVMGLVVGWSYVGLVGWEAPVLRAILLVTIFYWAQILGRKYSLTRGLGLAVIIMLVADRGLVASVSFWLSITAFLGVVTSRRLPVAQTIWVSVWVTPILAMVFGKVSLVAPVANVLVLLIVETITMVGMVAVVVNGWLLWLVYPLLRYFVWVVEGLGSWQWAAIGIRFNWWMLMGWYVVLVYFLIKKWGRENQ